MEQEHPHEYQEPQYLLELYTVVMFNVSSCNVGAHRFICFCLFPTWRTFKDIFTKYIKLTAPIHIFIHFRQAA